MDLSLFVGSMAVLGIRKAEIKNERGFGRELGSLVYKIFSHCTKYFPNVFFKGRKVAKHLKKSI